MADERFYFFFKKKNYFTVKIIYLKKLQKFEWWTQEVCYVF